MQIRLEEVNFSYLGSAPPKAALKEVNLTLNAGECLGLIGPSGSGKSTLALLLNGLLRPDHGRLLIAEKVLDYHPRALHNLRRRVGLIMQMPETQIFEATVFDEVAYAARRWEMPDDEIPSLVNHALSQVGLELDRYRHRDPLKLSGGEARLVTIASVLVVDPEWLILDEPTLGLDYEHSCQVRQLLLRRREQNRGTLLISHDLNMVGDVCRRVIALRDAQVQFDGETYELFCRRDLELQFGLTRPERWEIQCRLEQDLGTDISPADLETSLARLTGDERIAAKQTLLQYFKEQKLTEAAT